MSLPITSLNINQGQNSSLNNTYQVNSIYSKFKTQQKSINQSKRLQQFVDDLIMKQSSVDVFNFGLQNQWNKILHQKTEDNHQKYFNTNHKQKQEQNIFRNPSLKKNSANISFSKRNKSGPLKRANTRKYSQQKSIQQNEEINKILNNCKKQQTKQTQLKMLFAAPLKQQEKKKNFISKQQLQKKNETKYKLHTSQAQFLSLLYPFENPDALMLKLLSFNEQQKAVKNSYKQVMGQSGPKIRHKRKTNQSRKKGLLVKKSQINQLNNQNNGILSKKHKFYKSKPKKNYQEQQLSDQTQKFVKFAQQPDFYLKNVDDLIDQEQHKQNSRFKYSKKQKIQKKQGTFQQSSQEQYDFEQVNRTDNKILYGQGKHTNNLSSRFLKDETSNQNQMNKQDYLMKQQQYYKRLQQQCLAALGAKMIQKNIKNAQVQINNVNFYTRQYAMPQIAELIKQKQMRDFGQSTFQQNQIQSKKNHIISGQRRVYDNIMQQKSNQLNFTFRHQFSKQKKQSSNLQLNQFKKSPQIVFSPQIKLSPQMKRSQMKTNQQAKMVQQIKISLIDAENQQYKNMKYEKIKDEQSCSRQIDKIYILANSRGQSFELDTPLNPKLFQYIAQNDVGRILRDINHLIQKVILKHRHSSFLKKKQNSNIINNWNIVLSVLVIVIMLMLQFKYYVEDKNDSSHSNSFKLAELIQIICFFLISFNLILITGNSFNNYNKKIKRSSIIKEISQQINSYFKYINCNQNQNNHLKWVLGKDFFWIQVHLLKPNHKQSNHRQK